MKILASSIQSNFTIKKSKFYCFGHFVNSKEEVKDLINKYKKEYADASHICYAYILDDKTYYLTDGGEPSGTAGQPIFNALQSFHLNYTLLIVIRYFGGIKFGPGPLRSTFKDIAIQTLNLAKLKECQITDIIDIKVPYDKIKQILTTFRNSIYKKKYEKEYVLICLVGNKTLILEQLARLGIKPISIKENQVV
ncbi:MAG: YigZ family protein [Mycoplasmoidaceae bacterium]|nr:YigZ family protein [Mycoplasmoidaceae bacterium]